MLQLHCRNDKFRETYTEQVGITKKKSNFYLVFWKDPFSSTFVVSSSHHNRTSLYLQRSPAGPT